MGVDRIRGRRLPGRGEEPAGTRADTERMGSVESKQGARSSTEQQQQASAFDPRRPKKRRAVSDLLDGDGGHPPPRDPDDADEFSAGDPAHPQEARSGDGFERPAPAKVALTHAPPEPPAAATLPSPPAHAQPAEEAAAEVLSAIAPSTPPPGLPEPPVETIGAVAAAALPAPLPVQEVVDDVTVPLAPAAPRALLGTEGHARVHDVTAPEQPARPRVTSPLGPRPRAVPAEPDGPTDVIETTVPAAPALGDDQPPSGVHTAIDLGARKKP